MESLIQQLMRHEGTNKRNGRHYPYKCPSGKLTIGIGRNLDDRGISDNEAMYLLQNDIDECKREVSLYFPESDKLNQARYSVIVNMCFNIGISRLKGFKKMWAAINNEDFEEASRQMLDSKWAGQVGPRAVELSEIMKKGFQDDK